MFQRILIANRGEIAVRIARTCRHLGVEVVAVHSDADARAQHVLAADRAVAIGPAPVSESYLNAERILEAARDTGSQAIHPGYGFLSENPDFAEAVQEAGLVWIGPPADAIRAMGLKDAAKRLMEEAGVPVTPGYHGDEQDADFLSDKAAEIGYPVLIKASAGGGGKGMRRVDSPDAFAQALKSAKSEGRSSFGNDHVILEKFIENPRHIEVQVFADTHGHTLHLYERDCSAQRRHQKVIEEAPAPGMTPEVRQAMTGAAVRAAEAVGYVNAGTVEFIVDGSGPLRPDGFWFMEMNTRLQVEHPVTECVTGLDLVEWQLRVAAGEPLPLAQQDIPLNGHALEARLYAEDAARDFMPATGQLDRLAFPDEGVRVDTGVVQGDTVTPHYDPMIAKLITHGPDRAAAFGAMSRALAATHVEGVTTNLAFLERLVTQDAVREGRHDTGTIQREMEALTDPHEPEAQDLALAAGALSGLIDPGPLAGWRAWGPGRTHLALVQHGTDTTHDVSIWREPGTKRLVAETGAGAAEIEAVPLDASLWLCKSEGHARRVRIHRDGRRVKLVSAGRRQGFLMPDPVAAAEASGAGGDSVTAPLPGVVKSLDVAPGDTVEEGQVVAVMEAMKMEHSLTAPRTGTVSETMAQAGDQVEEGAVLITLEEE